jgi:hypothetical protein
MRVLYSGISEIHPWRVPAENGQSRNNPIVVPPLARYRAIQQKWKMETCGYSVINDMFVLYPNFSRDANIRAKAKTHLFRRNSTV